MYNEFDRLCGMQNKSTNTNLVFVHFLLSAKSHHKHFNLIYLCNGINSQQPNFQKNKIFTFEIAALIPAWHEPCLWYPQNTENREWRMDEKHTKHFMVNISFHFNDIWNIKENTSLYVFSFSEWFFFSSFILTRAKRFVTQKLIWILIVPF